MHTSSLQMFACMSPTRQEIALCIMQFKPPPMFTTFALTGATLAVFGFPAWLMAYEENKYLNFKEQ